MRGARPSALCKSCAIAMLEYGHISQRVRRSGLDSPANRYSGKTSFLSPRDWPKFITEQRPSQDLSCYESKALRRSESAMGKAKTYRRQSSKKKERRTHTSGPKETFPTNESSVVLRRAIAAIISALAFPCGGAKEARFGARELREIITDHTSKSERNVRLGVTPPFRPLRCHKMSHSPQPLAGALRCRHAACNPPGARSVQSQK
jgi:hypothetical protein